MKILAISNFYPPYHRGGYGMLCHRICEGLISRGHRVSVLTTACAPGARADSDDLRHSASDVFRLLVGVEPRSVARMLFNTRHNHLITKKMIRLSKPDIIYSFGMDGIGFDVFQTAFSSGIPLVAALGDTWLGQAWRNLLLFDPWTGVVAARGTTQLKRMTKKSIRVVGRLLGLHCDLRPGVRVPVHAISSFVLHDLRDAGGLDEKQCAVIPPPLFPPFISEPGEPIGRVSGRSKTLRALFVSRMELSKGPDTAIEALAHAVNAGADVSLTLAGIDSDKGKPALIEAAKTLSVGHLIRWADARTTEELVNLYRNHDVFVFPSRNREGFGIVCAEAMACGLPVLGTHPGGQTDIIKDGISGFLFTPGDHKVLGALLVKLGADRTLLDRLSEGAMREVRKCRASAVIDALEKFLQAGTNCKPSTTAYTGLSIESNS